ncbi:hypothetical protein PLUA15_160043 [Pseudomonas lundensis]|uniref:Uncharacterized protein n=1 Tax=Pseudomonas lundensis TaxID=86185 RepID=A0AAX2H498_9PSED|nr:hypothetical protein PLUA15_160043 [Pseudomonas lundensis]
MHIPDSYVLMAGLRGERGEAERLLWSLAPRDIRVQAPFGMGTHAGTANNNPPGTRRAGSTPVGGAWVSGSDYREPCRNRTRPGAAIRPRA